MDTQTDAKGISALGKTLGRYLLPTYCRLCGAACEQTLCSDCRADLPRNVAPSCRRCDVPLTQDAPLCAECLTRPPQFDHNISGLRYQYPVDQLIHRMKDKHAHEWLTVLAAPLLDRLRTQDREKLPEIICPVPLHWWRHFRRGYNQSTLLAQLLGQTLGIAVKQLIHKRRQTASQRGLNRRQRLHNLEDCFVCRADLNYSHIALVDDVMTTGATAELLAKLLKDAGVDRVDVWTLARTPKSASQSGL